MLYETRVNSAPQLQ